MYCYDEANRRVCLATFARHMRLRDLFASFRMVPGDACRLLVTVVTLLSWLTGLTVLAQTPALKLDVRAARGDVVSPVYEGWYQLDGTTYALFGYYSRNTDEVVDIAVGPDNRVSPGASDQGQPTRLYPGRHYGVFAVAVPPDTSETEVTWTLTANGRTFPIPATLHQEYLVSPQREDGGSFPGNTPPVVQFESDGPAAQGPLGIAVRRTATAGRPLHLDVWVTDDGLPPAVAGFGERLSSTDGLALRWRVYRGSGEVTVSDHTPALDEGRARTVVTFDRAGDYMLHLLASDSRSGTQCCWTNAYVRIAVGAEEQGEP